MIEPLEQRQHLSATLTGNVLTIVGTNRSDDIAIAAGREAFVVHDNGTQTAFATRQVRTIRIFGLAGDDSIIVSPRLGIRCSIEAGNGNDRVGGGAGDDTIFGGRGDDTLVGNGGNDYIDAGADDDVIEDALGINVIHGGSGSDRAFVDRAALGTGVENKTEIENPGGVEYAGVTDFVTESGRLIMRYTGFVPGLNDFEGQSGPIRLASGQYEVISTLKLSPIPGGIVNYYEHRWDVTDIIADGIVFTLEYGDDLDTWPQPATPQPLYSVPFVLPTR